MRSRKNNALFGKKITADPKISSSSPSHLTNGVVFRTDVYNFTMRHCNIIQNSKHKVLSLLF